jgi:hypothetical protein
MGEQRRPGTVPALALQFEAMRAVLERTLNREASDCQRLRQDRATKATRFHTLGQRSVLQSEDVKGIHCHILDTIGAMVELGRQELPQTKLTDTIPAN